MNSHFRYFPWYIKSDTGEIKFRVYIRPRASNIILRINSNYNLVNFRPSLVYFLSSFPIFSVNTREDPV